MELIFIRRALFLMVNLSLLGFSLPTDKIHEEYLSQALSRIVQPGSLVLWMDSSCGIQFNVRRMTTALKERNTTIFYQTNIRTTGVWHYITRVSLRNMPDHLHSYIMIDMCLLNNVIKDLEIFEYLFQRTNFIICTDSIFQVTSAYQVLCNTIQLIWAPAKEVFLLGLPEKHVSTNGCSDWHFYDYASLTRLFPFRIPWLPNVAAPSRSLRKAVIGGMCYPKCNISESFTVLSTLHNFTITDCTRGHIPCDFTEYDDRRLLRELISTGAALPLAIFSSQSPAFLAPKGTLRPK